MHVVHSMFASDACCSEVLLLIIARCLRCIRLVRWSAQIYRIDGRTDELLAW